MLAEPMSSRRFLLHEKDWRIRLQVSTQVDNKYLVFCTMSSHYFVCSVSGHECRDWSILLECIRK